MKTLHKSLIAFEITAALFSLGFSKPALAWWPIKYNVIIEDEAEPTKVIIKRPTMTYQGHEHYIDLRSSADGICLAKGYCRAYGVTQGTGDNIFMRYFVFVDQGGLVRTSFSPMYSSDGYYGYIGCMKKPVDTDDCPQPPEGTERVPDGYYPSYGKRGDSDVVVDLPPVVLPN